MNKTIKLTFIKDFDIDKSRIYLNFNNSLTGFTNSLRFQFQFAPRTSSGYIQIYNPDSSDNSPYTNAPGEYTASLFAYFFNIDKPTWVAEVEQQGTDVYIVASNNTIGQFNVEFLAPVGMLVLSDPLQIVNWDEFSSYISYSLLEDTAFAITNVEFIETNVQDSQCEKARIVITCNTNISKAVNINLSQFTYIPSLTPSAFPSPNVFEIEITRGVYNKFKLTGIDSFSVLTLDLEDIYPNIGSIQVPLLLESNFNINSIWSQSGSTVFINENIEINQNDVELELEYSLNNEDWFTENLISGQEDGDYTLYIRDQFGCVIEKNYSVGFQSINREPYHNISETNAIDYSLVEEIDNCSIKQNYFNSRNRNSLNNEVYSEDILFNLCDEITTQIKTNYENINVVLMKHNGDDLEVPVLQRTNNFNVFESLDCNFYEYSPDQVGLFYESGNIYNELNEIIDTFELNGGLPSFASEGNIVSIINYGDFLIQEIIFDENINKNVILIQNNFVSLPSTGISYSIYDILEFNVFEFGFKWGFLGEGLYKVKINLQDDIFEEVNYISENIYIKKNHENTLCLDYFSDNNRDIFYDFRLKNRIRINYLSIQYSVKEESLNNIGDLKAELVKSVVNKKDKYFFDALTEKRMTTLILALSSEFCFINGTPYVKEGSANINHIENTNLAYVEQEMIVASNNSYKLPKRYVDPFYIDVRPSPFVVSGINFLRG